MKRSQLEELRDSVRQSLIEDTAAFWMRHSVDREYGGFRTFLDRAGEPLDSDKGVWIQGRGAWIFSRLYNEIEQRQEWLDAASNAVQFIEKYCIDSDGRMFFIVSRDGRPVRKRRYFFSEVFAAMGLAEYAKAANDPRRLSRARELAARVEALYSTPGSTEPKIDPRTRRVKSHSATMIRINMYQVLRDAGVNSGYDEQIEKIIAELFEFFVRNDRQALLETVNDDGSLLDSPAGRCMNPGHALETAWFLLEEGERRKQPDLIQRSLEIVHWSLERGWDSRFGGLFYFVDEQGKQPEQLEWDMKLWWVHNEAIYACLYAYYLTREPFYWQWFERILDWTLAHFPDGEYGEWFGYLHRDGSVALDLKANHWKGPFHLPRQQALTVRLLDRLLAEDTK